MMSETLPSFAEATVGNNIKISMTENGDPLENAIAERLNGILKDEYLSDIPVRSIEDAREVLSTAVNL